MRDNALLQARVLSLEPPDRFCSELRAIITDSVHKTLTRQEVIALLAARGVHLRQQPNKEEADAVIAKLTKSYLDGAKRRLIGKRVLPRAATDVLLNKLGSTAGDSVMTGGAGGGKTGCVIEFVEQLQLKGIPTLVIRLDRISPVGTPEELGKSLGLKESPALTLAAAAGAREAVLVVDQLDAVSTTSGRASGFLDAIEGLLEEARGLRHRLALHVVVVCRKFDWKNDHQLRRLLPKNHTEVEVVGFTEAEVKHQLQEAGFDPGVFRDEQVRLLLLPQNLSLFLESEQLGRPITFRTATELFDHYWDEKRKAVASRARPAKDQWFETIRILVDEMAASQQLSVPRERLDQVAIDYLDQMASEGVVSHDGHRYAFGHESFFDYCFARTFNLKNVTLEEFLTASEQHLFRRAQVRQVLAYLRDADFARYLSELKRLLDSDRVRIHIKEVALAVLADVANPRPEEWALWQSLWAGLFDAVRAGQPNADRFASFAWRFFYSSERWFQFAYEDGAMARWLADSDGVANLMVNYIRRHQRHAGDLVASLLEPYEDAGGEWKLRLRHLVEWADQSNSRKYLDFTLRLIDNGTLDEARGPIASNSTFWSLFYSLGKAQPAWVAEVLAHWLRRQLTRAIAEEGQIDRGDLDRDTFAHEPIFDSAKADPAAFVRHVLPAVLEVAEHATQEQLELPHRDRVWGFTLKHDDERTSGPADAAFIGLDSSLQRLAAEGTDLTSIVSELAKRKTHLANFLLLNLYRTAGDRCAEEAVRLLCDEPWRFECGYTDSHYWCATQLIGAIAPHCSRETLDRLEERILGYSTKWERSPEGYKRAGWASFNLLSAIPAEYRGPRAGAQLEQLSRKFKEPERAPRGIRSGWARSPIASESAKKMTDDQWLGAIARYRSEHERWGEDFKGGAHELSMVLQESAKAEPERFARLALRFPNGANRAYGEQLLRGIEATTIPAELKIAACEKFFADDPIGYGDGIASALGHVGSELTDNVVSMLDFLAVTHPNPEKELWNVVPEGNSNPYYGGEIYTAGLNSTRGRAVGAIHSLLAADKANLPRFEPTLRKAVHDPSAAVRACVLGVLRVVAFHDMEMAISLLSSFDSSEEGVWATPHGSELIRRLLWDRRDVIWPVVASTLRSTDADCAQAGARLAAIARLNDEAASELEEEAFTGTKAQRLGVAEVASANISDAECREWCERRLIALFGDDDEKVRHEAATCFRHFGGQDDLSNYSGLIDAFCASKGFEEDSFSILHTLEET
ncbi:MAG: hypothetical protein KAY59_00170, partial [Acidobacteria bacterium]|nr:hypothetical protein [Acidobacteriota bacterium]